MSASPLFTSRFPSLFLAKALAVIFALGAPLVRADSFPAGDLTVTVEEQENGSVKFSLGGTAYLQQNGSFSSTNYSYSPGTPPATFFGSYGLPPGLKLTVPDRTEGSEEESVEEGPLATRDLLPTYVFGTMGWSLGWFTSGPLLAGDPITGSGSVISSSLPFSFFIPGTFEVGPGLETSEPESAADEAATLPTGIYPYSITYKVIPFTAEPRLTVATPSRFPKTRLLRSGGTRQVAVSNRGNVTIRNLSVSITGAASRDFSHGALPVTQLAPGASTRVSVSFKPRRTGTRNASLLVRGAYEPPAPVYDSEAEELPALDPPSPIPVSASAPLVGTGFLPQPNPRPNSPRFPFGFLGPR
jgi:hypothetical protein